MLDKKRYDLKIKVVEETIEKETKVEEKEPNVEEKETKVEEKKTNAIVEKEIETPTETQDIKLVSQVAWDNKLFLNFLLKNTLYGKDDFDSLFWSLFISQYGMTEYLRVKKSGKREVEEKTNLTTYLHKMDKTLRKECTNYKITNVLTTEIISDVMTFPKMPIYGLIPASIFYQTNIYVVDWKKRTYLSFETKGSLKQIFLIKNPLHSNPEYFIDDGTMIPMVFLQNHFIVLHQYEKPLKGVSTYKMEELEEMNDKLHHPFPISKKAELYEKLLVYCVWK